MIDDANLSFYHLTPDSVIKMSLWPEWRALVRAACKGDTQGTSYCRLEKLIPITWKAGQV